MVTTTTKKVTKKKTTTTKSGSQAPNNGQAKKKKTTPNNGANNKKSAATTASRTPTAVASNRNNNNKGTSNSNTTASGSTSTSTSNKILLMIVWILISCELILDFVTTVISFMAVVNDGETVCCEQPIDPGRGFPLAITIIFLLITLLEIILLIKCIRTYMMVTGGSTAGNESSSSNSNNAGTNCCSKLYYTILPGGLKGLTSGHAAWFRLINLLVLLNPFCGFIVAYILLDRANKEESFLVLALECGSMVLHWISIYIENKIEPKNRITFWFYALFPMIPFLVTVILIIILLQKGGICYLTGDDVFWIKGCELCQDTMLPRGDDGGCSNGVGIVQGSYCSPNDNGDFDSFCFYEY